MALIPLSSLMPASASLLSDATFKSAVTEIGNSLLGFGAERVLILDTGISTLAPVEAAIKATSDPSRMRHMKVFAGPRFVETAKLQQQPYGSHADEIETSLMLAIAPASVDMSRAKASPFSPGGPSRGPLSPDDPKSPNYSPSGSFGDRTLASAEKGKTILAAIVADSTDEAVDEAAKKAGHEACQRALAETSSIVQKYQLQEADFDIVGRPPKQ